jgi:hypothetical protein
MLRIDNIVFIYSRVWRHEHTVLLSITQDVQLVHTNATVT